MSKYIFTNDKEKFISGDLSESCIKEELGKTTDGKTIKGEFSRDGKSFTDTDGNVYHVNDAGEIVEWC